MMSAGPSWLPRIQIRRKSSRSEFRRMIFRQAKCRLVSRLKFRSSKMSPLMTSSRVWSTAHSRNSSSSLRLADVAAQVQVADDEAVVGRDRRGRAVGREVGHRRGPGRTSRRSSDRASVGLSPDRIVTRSPSPSRVIRHPRVVADESQLGEPGGGGAGQGRRRRCRSRPSGPAATARQGREQGQGRASAPTPRPTPGRSAACRAPR